MGAALPLRGDFDAADLRGVAKRSRDGAQSRRLLALAMIYDGHCRSDAARGSRLADHPGLGAALQCGRTGGLEEPQAPPSN